MDFQAIVDLVGDNLREVFQTKDFAIRWYDEKTNLVHYLYEFEKGTRLNIPPGPPPPGGSFENFLRDRQPIIGNTLEIMARSGGTSLPGTDTSKSLVSVPIIASNRVIGSLQMENYERENAYGESELRLLTTIAASLGTVLENARLFDETQRLLKITEDRAAELAIINSVQAALAAELNIQGIYDAVGDKIREITGSEIVMIQIWDIENGMRHDEYSFEKGKRFPISEHPFTLLEKSMIPDIQSGKTIVWNEGMEERIRKLNHSHIVVGVLPLSVVVVPLKTGKTDQKAITAISLQNSHEYAFSDSDVRLIETLANAMSVALENARLFDETQRLLKITEDRAAELAVINSIQQGLAAELDFQTIIDLVGDKLREVLNTGEIGIRWHEPKTNLIHYLYEYEHGERITIPSAPPQGMTWEKLVRTRQPIVLNTVSDMQDLGVTAVPGTDQSKSIMYVPIVGSDRVLGSIVTENYEKENAYTDADTRLLTTVASSMGVALENARLFDETQRLLKETEERNAELAIINSIGQALTQELDPSSLVDLVGDKLRSAIQTENIGIGLYNTSTNLITSIYVYKNGQRIYPDPSPLNEYSLRFSRQGKSLVLNDVTEEMWKKLGSNLTFGMDIPKSVIMVPILAGGVLIGGITVQDFNNPNAYPNSIVRLLETIASNMGTALENARLFKETQRLLKETEQRNAELAIINSVQDALAAKLDMQGIYDSVGDKIREIFKADTTFIVFHDVENNRIIAPYYIDRGIRPSIASRPYSKGLNEIIIESGKPLLLNTYEETAKAGAFNVASPDSDKDLNESFLGVPIFRNGKAIGATAVQSYKQFAYDQNDLRLLTTLSNSMGVALENARLFDETQRLLKETEERNAELAIINSVQAALAAELNIQGIYDAVGDKIREIFHGQIWTSVSMNHKTA